MVLAAGTVLLAHVGVAPRESTLGATETYTFAVPSEGGMSTNVVVLDVPDGVTVTSVSAPDGATHEETKAGDRIAQVTWKVAIKPGTSAKLSLVARNPSSGTEIVWKIHQKYTDGMSSDWVGAGGSRNPAPVTKLVPAADAR
jgi:uncharacterized protein YcnI